MHSYWRILQIVSIVTIFPMLLLSCGSDRVNIEFKTPRQIYVDDSKTDPDKLNKELEYDLREAEKKRRQKQREAEAAAKAKTEAEQKAKSGQSIPAEEETAQSEEVEQPTQQR
jgi:sensor histidine kinase YesM